MKKNQNGFTLIELLVVIAIIGLLSTLSIVALNSARARSRDARRVADVKQIQTALEMYYNEMNSYPTSTTSGSPIKGTGASSTYMTKVPDAPIPADGTCTAAANSNTYTYTIRENGASYTLTYCLGAKTGDIIAGVQTATPGGIR